MEREKVLKTMFALLFSSIFLAFPILGGIALLIAAIFNLGDLNQIARLIIGYIGASTIAIGAGGILTIWIWRQI